MATSDESDFDTWYAALQGTAKIADFLQIVGRDLLRSEVLKPQEFSEKQADPMQRARLLESYTLIGHCRCPFRDTR